MRVALVCAYSWDRPGGVRAHIAALATQLAPRHEVRVFAPRTPWLPRRQRAAGLFPAESVKRVGWAVPVPYNGSIAPVALSPFAARHALEAVREFGPDIVHVHEPLVPATAAAVAGLGPHPVVGTFHSWSDRARLYRGIAPLGRRIAARLDARVAVSPAARRYAAEALGLPADDFRVIPNGVDAAAFAGAQPLAELADRGRPLLLFVGRLEPRKGLDVAIRTFLRLRATVDGLRLCVVGDGPERARCQELVPPPLRPDVRFVGRVSERDLPRYHASADLFLAPATGGESFGIVLLEAMAAGLPIVASDIPGYRTVLRDGVQGRLVPPSDASAAADAAAAILSSPSTAKALAEEGRATAAQHAWPVVRREVEKLYDEIVG